MTAAPATATAAPLEAVAACRHRRQPLRSAARPPPAQRGREADRAGHVLGAAALASLLAPAAQQRLERDVAADDQRPGACRAAELVRGDRDQVAAGDEPRQVEPRRGGDGVAVQHDRRARAAPSALDELVERLDDARSRCWPP